MNEFSVNIIGLAKKQYSFSFKLDKRFFEQYGDQAVPDGNFDAKVILDKRETLIEADFEIVGTADLVCDRSLEPFAHQMKIHRKVILKYGEAYQEVSDEVVVIPHEQDKLDVGQFMYEFIILEVPIKKVHPRFQNEEDDSLEEDTTLVYSTDKQEDEGSIDPRWEQLKKLKGSKEK